MRTPNQPLSGFGGHHTSHLQPFPTQLSIRRQSCGRPRKHHAAVAHEQAAVGDAQRQRQLLLNQQHLAGVGNLYADEICYQTRIHPATRIESLSLDEQKLIFASMQQILNYAVERRANYKDYPEDWLWQWRVEGFVPPDGRGVVKKATIAGRTTYFLDGL